MGAQTLIHAYSERCLSSHGPVCGGMPRENAPLRGGRSCFRMDGTLVGTIPARTFVWATTSSNDCGGCKLCSTAPVLKPLNS